MSRTSKRQRAATTGPPPAAAPAGAFERVLAAPWFLPATLGLAAVLRLAHVLSLRGTPFFDTLTLDPRAYDEWAVRIAAGDWRGPGAFFVDPLYAYVLGVLYAVFGRSLLLVRVLQAGLGVATCALTARLGRRALGSPALGNLAGLVMALYVPAVHYDATVEKTGVALFLLVAALVVYFEESPRAPAAAGALLGLAALARGSLLVLLPLGAAALWRAPGGSPRRAALFAGAALAVVSLATIHNAAAGGGFVLTTANAGQNLFIGQHVGNADGAYTPPAFVRPDPRYEEADFRAEAERRAGRPLTASEVSRFWGASALEEMAAAPRATLLRTWRKLRLLVHDWETPDNDDVALVAAYAPLLRLPFVRMGTLFPLALLGGIVWWRRRREVRLLAGAALACAGTLLVFFVLGRLRMVLVPIAAVLAAGGVGWAVERVRARDWRRAGAAAALLLAAALAAYTEPDWIAHARRSGLATAFNNLGAQRVEAGDVEGGIAAYERAIAIDDATVIASLRALGDLYLARGDFARAEARMTRVLALKPDSPLAKQALGRLAAALQARSRALRDEGRFPEAIATLEAMIRVGPYDEDARYLLGGLMEAHATPDEMVRYWSAEAATDPKPQTAWYFWAVGLERAGDGDGAIEKLKRALEIDPAHEMSEHRWGGILEKRGELAAALEHYARATEIHPEFRTAHESCARVLAALGRDAEAKERLELAAHSDPATPRRFVYWARWLAKSGRTDAAVAELERALRGNPGDTEARALLEELRPGASAALAAAPPAPAAAGAGSGTAAAPAIAPELRGRLVESLRAAGPAPVWLCVQRADPAAAALGAELHAAFAEAGWTVRADADVPFRMKPGVFLFAAEDTAPAYAGAAGEALAAAGLAPSYALGYRSYYEEMTRTKPGWLGFPFEADQTWLVVVGPGARLTGGPGPAP